MSVDLAFTLVLLLARLALHPGSRRTKCKNEYGQGANQNRHSEPPEKTDCIASAGPACRSFPECSCNNDRACLRRSADVVAEIP